MKIIADSGSTKTDWLCLLSNGCRLPIVSEGLSPVHQPRETLLRVLGDVRSKAMAALPDSEQLSEVYFYGSGVAGIYRNVMLGCLADVFPEAIVSAESDMLGAARALFGNEAGVAVILGTGSNSALYDGQRIVGGTPALGYILGDEGSGAVLGKQLVGDLYKGSLPVALRSIFEEETGLTMTDIIERVYRQPLANRFLASLVPFIHHHKAEWPQLSEMVTNSFRQFLVRNLQPYGPQGRRFAAVGSVAFFFAAELHQAATAEGLTLAGIERSPITLLAAYHSGR